MSETLHCPECGHDGAFDYRGQETEFARRIRLDDSSIRREYKVEKQWEEFHCFECDCYFRTLLNETEEQQPGPVIA